MEPGGPAASTDLYERYAEQKGQFFDPVRKMSRADRAMMRRTGLGPTVHKGARADREAIAAVRILY